MTEISICLRLSKYLYYILACGLGCWKDWGDFESHSAFSAKCPGDQTMRDTPVNREAAALVSHCREDKILRSVSIPKHVLTAPWAKSRILLCNFTLLAVCTEPRCHGCQDRVCNCHLPVQKHAMGAVGLRRSGSLLILSKKWCTRWLRWLSYWWTAPCDIVHKAPSETLP